VAQRFTAAITNLFSAPALAAEVTSSRKTLFPQPVKRYPDTKPQVFRILFAVTGIDIGIVQHRSGHSITGILRKKKPL
jgi:hypothetical protein